MAWVFKQVSLLARGRYLSVASFTGLAQLLHVLFISSLMDLHRHLAGSGGTLLTQIPYIAWKDQDLQGPGDCVLEQDALQQQRGIYSVSAKAQPGYKL